jgi:hypothetical protein
MMGSKNDRQTDRPAGKRMVAAGASSSLKESGYHNFKL